MQHVMKKRYILAALVIFGLWNFIQIFRTLGSQPDDEKSLDNAVDRMTKLISELRSAITEARSFKGEMENWFLRVKHTRPHLNITDHGSKELPHNSDNLPGQPASNEHQKQINYDALKVAVLPVLVFACNRPTVSVHLEQLLKHRFSAHRFPIIVTQDCGHEDTKRAISQYGDAVTLIEHPDLSDIEITEPKLKKYVGYYKIARHYKWALNQIFYHFNYSAVIITEDDLNIAPDFFEYFSAVYPIMVKDKSLWCASAWNDNGKDSLVLDLPDLLHRTDFFPGLGWMLTKDIWDEMAPKWPATFWDDWMRHPDQRKDRACIRPEISRTTTFGRIGVSKGQYFDKHLKFIRLNTKFIPFTQLDLSYLEKERYDPEFHKQVYGSPVSTISDIQAGVFPDVPAVRLSYNDKTSFKEIAKLVGVMDDFKSGVMRMAYRGVVSIGQQGHRVYLAPAQNWTAYDTSW